MLAWKYLNGKFYLSDQELNPTSSRTLEEMRPVLRDPKASGPELTYSVFRDIPDPEKKEGVRTDLTIIEPGFLGEEYNKTHGHYHLGEGDESYSVLSGNGMMVMQKPSFNFDSVDAVRIVKLTVGQKIDVPSGWGHNLVNTGRTPLMTVNYQDPNLETLYSAYAKKRGAAYYIVGSNGEIKLEANPAYGEVPKPQTF